MEILLPIQINDALLSYSSVNEPAPSETVWSGTRTYSAGDFAIRVETHRVYQCERAISAGRNVPPELDPTYWLDYGPTLKWAPFDTAVTTAATGTTSITYKITPGFFNAVALYGVTGDKLAVTVRDTPSGSIITPGGAPVIFELLDPPFDWYDWAFGPFRPRASAVVRDLTPYPNAELTITVSAPVDQPVGLGLVTVGDLRDLADGAPWGGTLAGAQANPVDYSYIVTDTYGNTKIVKRNNATNLSLKVAMPREWADTALATLRSVLAVPCACVATRSAGFDGLTTFGLISGTMSYDSAGVATLTINVRGLI